MFEFAISQHQKRKPSRRFVFSSILSCLLHAAFLLTLIRFPQLLDTGVSRWFRGQLQSPALADKDWRPVALINTSPGKMSMPSEETLRRVIYDWEKDKSKAGQPPIRVRWSAQQLAALEDKMEARPPAKPAPGTKEPQPAPPVAADSTPLAPSGVSGGAAAGQERGGIVYLPQPQPGTTPKQIPEKIAEAPRPAPPVAKPAADKSTTPADAAAAAPKAGQAQVFRDQQSAIRSQGSGLFDTKGFPMGDYATLVIERVKSNWFIPSYLRNSQGSTTIVFYIARDGHFLDARIVVPSGSNSLDLAALSAIVGSNPFPPLPEGFPANRVGAKFVFSYNERQ